MNSTSPANIFGGTWTQITDRFLYCANSSKTTGGSSTITEANLPSHTHTFTGVEATEDLQFRRSTNSNNVYTDGSNGIFTFNKEGGTSWQYTTDFSYNPSNSDIVTWTYTPEGTLSETGSGEEFLPPYITVYAWYRTA